MHGLHMDDERPRGVHHRGDGGTQQIDVAQRESNRRIDMLTRRSQDAMLVRPWIGDVTNGTPMVWEIASGRGTQHQVELFTRQ